MPLGQTFRDELKAKEVATGLSLLVPGVFWNTNHATKNMDPLPEGLTAAQITAINEVVAAHDNTKPAIKDQATLDRDDALTKADVVAADDLVPASVKAFATALKKVL